MDTELRVARIPKRPLAYAVAIGLLIFGAVWLVRSLRPPHTAAAMVGIQESFSTGPEWPDVRFPQEPGGLSRAFQPLTHGLIDEEVADRLQSLFVGVPIDAQYVRDRIGLAFDNDGHRVTISFANDRRDLAVEAANSVVAVYLEHLDRIREEAAEQGIPHWQVASLRLASSAGGADALVITAYLLGSAVVITMIPRTWWSAPIQVAKEARSMLLLITVGAIGFIVFTTTDLAGYGYPGFGAIQFIGSVLSFAAVAFAAVALSDHRREDEPAP